MNITLNTIQNKPITSFKSIRDFNRVSNQVVDAFDRMQRKEPHLSDIELVDIRKIDGTETRVRVSLDAHIYSLQKPKFVAKIPMAFVPQKVIKTDSDGNREFIDHDVEDVINNKFISLLDRISKWSDRVLLNNRRNPNISVILDEGKSPAGTVANGLIDSIYGLQNRVGSLVDAPLKKEAVRLRAENVFGSLLEPLKTIGFIQDEFKQRLLPSEKITLDSVSLDTLYDATIIHGTVENRKGLEELFYADSFNPRGNTEMALRELRKRGNKR